MLIRPIKNKVFKDSKNKSFYTHFFVFVSFILSNNILVLSPWDEMRKVDEWVENTTE